MSQTQQSGIDVSTYLADKTAGKVRIVKFDGRVWYSRKSFHPETGLPTPRQFPLEREQVQASLDQAQKDVAIFTAILADMDAAQELAPAGGA
jgi:hypothetical protein